MRSSACDAAGKQQHARFVVKERLPRGRRAEQARFHAVVVAHDRYVGQGSCRPPQIGPSPLIGNTGGLHEEDIRLRPNDGPRQRFGELVDARARARALRMREQDQSGSPICANQRRAAGPGCRCDCALARLVLIRPEHGQSRCCGGQPECCGEPEPGTGSYFSLCRRMKLCRQIADRPAMSSPTSQMNERLAQITGGE